MKNFETPLIENNEAEKEKAEQQIAFAIKNNKELSRAFEEVVRQKYGAKIREGEYPYESFIHSLLLDFPNREDFQQEIQGQLEGMRGMAGGPYKKEMEAVAKQWEQDFGSSYEDSTLKLTNIIYGGAKEYLDSKASELESKISQAASFEDLYKTITEAGGIQAQDGHIYKAEDLNYILRTVRDGLRDETYITRTGGLRSKVMDLLGKRK